MMAFEKSFVFLGLLRRLLIGLELVLSQSRSYGCSEHLFVKFTIVFIFGLSMIQIPILYTEFVQEQRSRVALLM